MNTRKNPNETQRSTTETPLHRRDADISSAVDLVHTQLEVLKYIGGKKNLVGAKEDFSGEGVNMEIVLLPDLVLDFRNDNLEPSQEHTLGPVCAVGGRATRTACILAHLIDDTDGLYKLHLITRTGNLGKLALQNALFPQKTGEQNENKENREHVGNLAMLPAKRTLNTECVLVREGEPRWALRGRSQEKVIPINLKDPTYELTAENIQSGLPRELIQRARTVFLASMKNPQADIIAEHILADLTVPRSMLFLDGTRSFLIENDDDDIDYANLERLANILQNNNVQGKIAAVFFLKQEFETILKDFQAKSTSEQAQKIMSPIVALHPDHNGMERNAANVSLILYGNEENRGFVVVFDGTKRVEGQLDGALFLNDDAPERFKAGYLLVSTLHRAVLTLEDEMKNGRVEHNDLCDLIKYLADQWNDENWIETAIDYGLALVATQARGEFCSLSDIVKNAAPRARRHVIEDQSFRGADVPVVPHYGEGSRIQFGQALVPTCARLAAQRRGGTLKYHHLSLCQEGEPKCIQGCLHRKSDRIDRLDRPSAAVLFDLDATLLASSEQRARGLSAALEALEQNLPPIQGSRPWPNDWEERIKAFEKYVYGYHDVFDSEVMNLGSFRQVWNHEGWYAAYIVFLLKKCDLLQWEKGIRNSLGNTSTEQSDLFKKKYDEVLDEHRKAISAAQRAFDEVAMNPLNEAYDLLESLRQTGRINLYVVSEGDPETQWRKIERTGLSRYFDREHVLTTGDATFPEKYENEFNQEKELIEEQKRNVESKMDKLRAGIEMVLEYRLERNAQGNIEQAVADDTAYESIWKRINQEYCEHFKELMKLENQLKSATFAERVIERLKIKEQVSVYAAAIRAILASPQNPRGKLRDFIELINAETTTESKMKLAMVGDRVDNDIKPVIDLLTHEKIVTIRLRSGAYARRQGNEPPGVHPMFDCNTLAEVKALLLSKNTWNRIRCVEGTSLFGWQINIKNRSFFPENTDERTQIGLDYLVNGISLDSREYKLIHHICRGVLWEQLLLCAPDKAYTILEHFVRPPMGGERRGDYSPKQRECVVRALVEVGIKNHERFIDYKSSIGAV